MEDKGREKNSGTVDNSKIIEALIKNSPSFSFIQAIRLLIRQISLKTGEQDILEKYIRIRPELSLRFPGTDITGVEKKQNDDDLQYLVTATFLGLYGSSSPLPTFYTEDLIEEFNEEGSIRRDFLDITHHRLYPILFKIWSKHNLFYKICEENDTKTIDLIYALLGLENSELRKHTLNHEKYFKYTGLIMQFPRSAEGLVAMIADFFNLKGHVDVNQCVLRKVIIPKDQLSSLGCSYCTLGEDCVIGSETTDISGKFQIVIKNADSETLHDFLPNQSKFKALKEMIRFYVNQPLKWELLIEMPGLRAKTAEPGSKKWSNLGWNTWLCSKKQLSKKVVTVLN